MAILILMLLGLIILALVFVFAFPPLTPKEIGDEGEAYIARALARRLGPSEYIIYNNVLIPDGQGHTAQIDHLVLSLYGIFVIETKNYGGWIFGDEYSKYWTSVHYQDRKRLPNPYPQNKRHIRALVHVLQIYPEHFFSVIACIGPGEIKTLDRLPNNLCLSANDVCNYIQSFKTPILDIPIMHKLIRRLADARLGKEAREQRKLRRQQKQPTE